MGSSDLLHLKVKLEKDEEKMKPHCEKCGGNCEKCTENATCPVITDQRNIDRYFCNSHYGSCGTCPQWRECTLKEQD